MKFFLFVLLFVIVAIFAEPVPQSEGFDGISDVFGNGGDDGMSSLTDTGADQTGESNPNDNLSGGLTFAPVNSGGESSSYRK